jgi:hypothetical protein
MDLAFEHFPFHFPRVPIRWNETDRYKVAEMLVLKYPRLGTDKLVAAARESKHGGGPLAGWDGLARCMQAYLENQAGAPEKRPE